MSKVSTPFNDYLSLAIMLLMFAALLGSPVDSTNGAADDAWSIEAVGVVKGAVLEVSVAVVSDLRQFRGEDE